MICSNDIFCFCESGNMTAVERLLVEGVHPDSENSDGNTALQIAATIGHLEMVDLLLKYGASIDFSSLYGWTPLMHAVHHENFSVVKFLIKMKAKVNISTKLGISPVVIASWQGNLPILQLLVEAGAIVNQAPSNNQCIECNLSAIMAAALQGHTDVISFLLDQGVEVNSVSPITGLSPLMLSASGNHLESVKRLLNAGADLELLDICNQSAFIHAQLNNAVDVMDYLKSISPTLGNQSNTDFAENTFFSDRKSIYLSAKTGGKESCYLSANISPGEQSVDSVFLSPDKREAVEPERVLPRKSQSETNVKDWIGGVLTHLSPRTSRTSSWISEDVPSDEDVFEIPSEPTPILAPEKLYEEELKTHTVGDIISPCPSVLYTPLCSQPIPAPKRPHGNSLRLKMLLKHRAKKKDSAKDSVSKIPVFKYSPVLLEVTDQPPLSPSASLGISEKQDDVFDPCSKDDRCFEATNDGVINVLKATHKEKEIENKKSNQEDLQYLLQKTSLQKYVDLFKDQEIDMKTFQHLTEDDLKEIGIQSFDSKQKLMDLIRNTRKS